MKTDECGSIWHESLLCVFFLLLTNKLPVFVVLYISGSCILSLIDISLNQDYYNVFYVSLQGKESSTSALMGCSAFRVFSFSTAPKWLSLSTSLW